MLVLDSAVKHSLADVSYGQRQAQWRSFFHHGRALREATLELLNPSGNSHDVAAIAAPATSLEKNARVNAFANALARGDWDEAGVAMRGSHASA